MTFSKVEKNEVTPETVEEPITYTNHHYKYTHPYLYMIDNVWIYQTHEQYYSSILGLNDSNHIITPIITVPFTETTMEPEVTIEVTQTIKAAKAYLLERSKYLRYLN